ncbi:hypothetical protein K491DRAFT_690053 [Lophiostoma macrostomum CBS 122681]|uniref:Uncharacterized protein n=1 Tax=Lophiostoma macrostomum CBS 122681 TaxID=1314788 RepID=A0A6A6THW7_9PLEO|nr:hypothetical protein K491DRAFT_690053 [Lophiostoma macrostomum CBS 122681]
MFTCHQAVSGKGAATKRHFKDGKAMAGVAKPVHQLKPTPTKTKVANSNNNQTEVDDQLSDPDDHGTVYLRTRAQTRIVQAKPKRTPLHLQWDKEPGSDSDPDIIAPGWNMPHQRSHAKARKDSSESEDELAKGPASFGGGPRKVGGRKK